MLTPCTNHPTVEAGSHCATCLRPFCDACLVEILGQRLCGTCRDQRVAQLQGYQPQVATLGAPLAGTGTVDIGGWLTRGWELVKSDIGAFAIATLLSGLVTLITCGICAGPMQAGMYMMVFRKTLTGRVESGQVFDGFRRALWAILGAVLIGMISGGIGFITGLPSMGLAMYAEVQNSDGLRIASQILNYAISLPVGCVVGGAFFFVLPHIAARNVDPIQAISASWAVFTRNWVMFSVISLVFQLIAGLGAMACCLGLLVAAPVIAAATAVAYMDHFGLDAYEIR